MTYTCIYNYIICIYIIVAYSPPSMVVFKLKKIVSKPGAWVAGGGWGNKLTLRKRFVSGGKTSVLICFKRELKR